MREEDVKLDAVRARCNLLFIFVDVFSWTLNHPIFILLLLLAVSNVLKRHSELAERLSRYWILKIYLFSFTGISMSFQVFQ